MRRFRSREKKKRSDELQFFFLIPLRGGSCARAGAKDSRISKLFLNENRCASCLRATTVDDLIDASGFSNKIINEIRLYIGYSEGVVPIVGNHH